MLLLALNLQLDFTCFFYLWLNFVCALINWIVPQVSLQIEFIDFRRKYNVKHTNWVSSGKRLDLVCPVHYAMHSAACATVNSRWISGRDEYFVILYSWKQCTQAITHGFKSIPVTWEWFPVCPHHNRSGKISLVTALLHVCIKIVKKLQWPGWFE